MNQLRRLYLLIKEIGIADLVSFSLYQAQLRSGPTRQLTPPGGLPSFQAQFTESFVPTFCWQSNWDRLVESKPSLLMEDETRLAERGAIQTLLQQTANARL